MADKRMLVNIIDKITEANGAPCKKTLQKIVFLIEAKKFDLGFTYGIHFYGPYSADLDFTVRELCDEDVLKNEFTSTNHIITVVNHSVGAKSSNEVVDHVVNKFGKETPSELELIATALYVYTSTKNKDTIKAGVKKIKGEKYSDDRIEKAIRKLEEDGYLAA